MLRKRCPLSHGAIIWMVGCLLKYSDINFFGISDTSNRLYGVNPKLVDDPMLIQNKFLVLFTRLRCQVVSGSLCANTSIKQDSKECHHSKGWELMNPILVLQNTCYSNRIGFVLIPFECAL